ncbi:integral membrane protein [Aspergillus sp. HF37]|nr:integral membrane protein [Aspergillus sp. HF37]
MQLKHPLQRIPSPSRGLSALVHALGLASFCWSFKLNEAYGWHFQYLTVIGLSLSTLTFAVALLADLTVSPRLFLVKNLFSVCSAPMEVLISVLYWCLRLIDERLVLPSWVVLPLHAGKDECLDTQCWYPYPIFEQVPFEGRVGLFVLSAVVMAFSTATLKWLHGRVNGYGTAAAAQSRPGAVKQNGVL